MVIKCLPVGIYYANCYIIMDEITKEAAIIDPGGDSEYILKCLDEIRGKLKFILLTHAHMDHIGGIQGIIDRHKVPVYLNNKDDEIIKTGDPLFPRINIDSVKLHLKDGDILSLGEKVIKCIETPGHTPGGMSFLIENMVFTGDTLFNGSIGRTDFLGGDYETLISSIKLKLLILPEETIVLPGHESETTIGIEKKHNPFL